MIGEYPEIHVDELPREEANKIFEEQRLTSALSEIERAIKSGKHAIVLNPYESKTDLVRISVNSDVRELLQNSRVNFRTEVQVFWAEPNVRYFVLVDEDIYTGEAGVRLVHPADMKTA